MTEDEYTNVFRIQQRRLPAFTRRKGNGMVKTLKERFISEIFDSHDIDASYMVRSLIDPMPEDILAEYLDDNGMMPDEEGEEV